MKDVRRDDDEPANGVNGDDAKGKSNSPQASGMGTEAVAVVDSPMLAHDELDTAE